VKDRRIGGSGPTALWRRPRPQSPGASLGSLVAWSCVEFGALQLALCSNVHSCRRSVARHAPVALRDTLGLPCINFVLEPGDVSRSDANWGGKFTATNAPVQRDSIVDVTEFHKRIEAKKLLHGTSRELLNTMQNIVRGPDERNRKWAQLWPGKPCRISFRWRLSAFLTVATTPIWGSLFFREPTINRANLASSKSGFRPSASRALRTSHSSRRASSGFFGLVLPFLGRDFRTLRPISAKRARERIAQSSA